MKSFLLFAILFFIAGANKVAAQASVTITSNTVAAASLPQNSINNIIYVVKMDVASQNVTVNSVQVPLLGTYNATDLSRLSVYYNPTAPTISGSSLLNYIIPNAAGPNTFTVNALSTIINAGSSGYFIFAVNVSATATNGSTVKVNGATAPIVFGFSTVPTLNNNQSDVAGLQTIQAASITVSSSSVAAANLTQGSVNNIVYVAKLDVASQNVTVNNVQVPLLGTYNSTDLTRLSVYYNATAPTITGATLLNYIVPTVAGPNTYTINALSTAINAGGSGYFIFTVNVNAIATNGNTVKVNGATAPVVFGFSTAPTIINSQTDAAGLQTIQAASVTVSSPSVSAANLPQNSINDIIYVAKMDVATQNVLVNSVQVPLLGTYNATDLTRLSVYYNPTAPTISGSSLLNYIIPNTAGPNTVTINALNQAINAGNSGYFIFTVNVSATAANGNTIKVNGASSPVVFGFSTAPTLTNNQNDAAGLQTIQAASVALSASNVAAASLPQNSINNIVYVAKMDVAAQNVLVNSVQIPLLGTYSATDLTRLSVYYNATAPTISGATLLNYIIPNVAGPNTFTVNALSTTINAGGSGYFIFTVNVSATAMSGNTIKVNGATAPVVFGFSTAPTIINNQSDAAGSQVIQGAIVTITSPTVSSSVMPLGSNNNVIYAAKMDVAAQNVTVSNVQVPLLGTYNSTDLTRLSVYYNPTAPTISGSSLLNYIIPNVAGPNTYTINALSQTINAGSSGYFIFAVNVSATATSGSTVKVNGAANPVVFGFATGAAVNNNQTNASGTQSINAVLPVTLTSFTAKAIGSMVQIDWATASEINNRFFAVERSVDGSNFIQIASINGQGTTTSGSSYRLSDNVPNNGVNYYRLKQVDQDGKYKYSSVVKVFVGKSGLQLLTVRQNPVRGTLYYLITSPQNEKASLLLLDASGKEIMRSTESLVQGDNNLQWNLGASASGIYYLQLITSGGKNNTVQKIVVQ